MNFRNIIGIICLSVSLLIASVSINVFQLWSFLGNYIIPWFCSALSISLLIVAMLSLITEKSPSSLSLSHIIIVIAGTSVTIGLGMLIDSLSYYRCNDWLVSIAEWFAFTIMLIIIFLIPRIKNRNKVE